MSDIVSLGALHEQLVEHLMAARANAIVLKFDHHFISEVEHLISTANANKEVK